jgi:hypothetical protein
MKFTGGIMKRKLLVALLFLLMPLAQAQETSFRPQADVERDAAWAAHEAMSKIQSDGLHGLIVEIKDCYSKTKQPAYRCAYLDGAASTIDEGMASSVGLPTHYTDEFLNPDAVQGRVMAQYTAAGVSEHSATVDVVDALVIISKIINHNNDSPPPPQETTSDEPTGGDDLCTHQDVQAQLIAAFNSAKVLTAEHGRLVRVSNLKTAMVSDSDITCQGDYTYSDGTTKFTAFGFSGDFVPPASQAHVIPRHCESAEGRVDVLAQLPSILHIDPSAATITDVKFLIDQPRLTYYPAVNGEKALHMLQCPVRVTWSNGHQDAGYFEEWDDHYNQIRVYFGHDPYSPN